MNDPAFYFSIVAKIIIFAASNLMLMTVGSVSRKFQPKGYFSIKIAAYTILKQVLPLMTLLLCSNLLLAQNHELVILHTNDTHSQLEPYSYKLDTNVGGVLRREAYVREVRAANPNVLLFDAGDFSQGTPYFNFFKGYVEVEFMNVMGYNAAALGNHEFDNGCEALAKRLKTADFPVLCANYEFKNRKLAKIIKPYDIIEIDGLRVGVFGLTVNLSALISPTTMTELTYLDPVASARKMVELLQEEHCDLIICLSHLGIDSGMVNDYVVAEQVPGIDVIIGGHSHKLLNPPVQVGNTQVYQAAKQGKYIGQITLTY